MSPQFCKVGTIKPNLDKLSSLKNKNKRIPKFLDEVVKLENQKKH